MEEGVTAFVKVLTEWLAATFSSLKSCVKMIFIFSSEFFPLFVRIESLPGVQAEDPVAQIFMGRVPTAHNMEFKMIMMIKMTMMMRIG